MKMSNVQEVNLNAKGRSKTNASKGKALVKNISKRSSDKNVVKKALVKGKKIAPKKPKTIRKNVVAQKKKKVVRRFENNDSPVEQNMAGISSEEECSDIDDPTVVHELNNDKMGSLSDRELLRIAQFISLGKDKDCVGPPANSAQNDDALDGADDNNMSAHNNLSREAESRCFG